jgi:ABC-type sugar transport system ATPase subunit
MALAARIVILNAGRIVQVRTPMGLYDHPTSAFVASFTGSPKMNTYEGKIAAKHGCKT